MLKWNELYWIEIFRLLGLPDIVALAAAPSPECRTETQTHFTTATNILDNSLPFFKKSQPTFPYPSRLYNPHRHRPFLEVSGPSF